MLHSSSPEDGRTIPITVMAVNKNSAISLGQLDDDAFVINRPILAVFVPAIIG